MWANLRRRFGRLVYQVPPQEPPTVRLPPSPADVEAAIAGVDMRLRELIAIPASVRLEAHWEEIDRLLDRRMWLGVRLRPAVPVVPGRSS